MKMKFFILAIVLGTLFCSQGVAKDKFVDYNYELTRDGVGTVKSRDPGFVIFTVYSYGRRERLTTDICMRNAIHGLIFKGLPAEDGVGAVPALIGATPYEDYKEYFDNFFSGPYKQFVEETNKGMQDVMKVGKEYKVGVKVRVNVKLLKQRLRQDGIIKDYKRLLM